MRVSTASSSKSSEVGWRGSTHHSQGRTQPHCMGLTPFYPQTSCHPQRGWWRPLMASTVWGRAGLAPSPMAVGRERWLKWHLQEAKERRCWPERSSCNCPAFSWTPSAPSARWKDPSGWDMGTPRVPEVPLGWLPSPDTELASPCFGL